MQPAIRVEGVGKRYRVPQGEGRASYHTLRDSLAAAVRGLRRRPTGGPAADEFWALDDVSFEVAPGEVVGIIGRNGAGKSTLLKVLSRITRPTRGRVELAGRVGSLLEVGTGFHPELTGRENVYLNGSILGMSRAEVARKFDEIVAFSEVEQFLDTPVKRYSSGMYVRLAFAVAAHLEPEILIVDEVLAVGDAGFQQKCFRKMDEVRRSGRTVLVVSHNLGAVRTLCTTAVNLEGGRLMGQGPVEEQVTWYLSRLADRAALPLADRADREGAGRVRVVRVDARVGDGPAGQTAVCGEPLALDVECRADRPDEPVDSVALSFWTRDGVKVAHVDTLMSDGPVGGAGQRRVFTCRLPRLPFPPGSYQVNVAVFGGGRLQDHVYSAAELSVDPGDFYRVGRTTDPVGGLVLLDHGWAVADRT
jgi:lipopolysaccharide transport system ATP-binding protein